MKNYTRPTFVIIPLDHIPQKEGIAPCICKQQLRNLTNCLTDRLNIGKSSQETSLGDEESNAAAVIGPLVAIVAIVIIIAVLVVVYVRRGRAVKLKSNRQSGTHIVNNDEQEMAPDGTCSTVQRNIAQSIFRSFYYNHFERLLLIKSYLQTVTVSYYGFLLSHFISLIRLPEACWLRQVASI